MRSQVALNSLVDTPKKEHQKHRLKRPEGKREYETIFTVCKVCYEQFFEEYIYLFDTKGMYYSLLGFDTTFYLLMEIKEDEWSLAISNVGHIPINRVIMVSGSI